MNKLKLKEFVEQNPKLVNMKSAGDGIFVLKYKKNVFFDDLWNDYLEECRGTIVDKDFNLVTYPFTKIYNYGIEEKAPLISLDTYVDAYRKVNGFMVAITWYNGSLLISTTGSTNSKYVEMARELIDIERYSQICKHYNMYTFMFECVHRNDPHIIPEKEGMYLLGYRIKDWNSSVDIGTNTLKFFEVSFATIPVEHYYMTMGDVLKEVKKVKHEGFVVYTKDNISTKIKSPYYLTKKWVARNPRTDKIVDMKNDIKRKLDEEYHILIDKIRANIVEYTAMNEQQRLEWIRGVL